MTERKGDRSPWAEETFHCPEHGWHDGIVCTSCYAIQQERVERESEPLRLANTSENLRARVLAELSSKNGHP